MARQEKETNSLGIPHVVATDPANQFKFVTRVPTTDWSLRTLAIDQDAFYEKADKQFGKPVPRAGHEWSVYLREDDPITE